MTKTRKRIFSAIACLLMATAFIWQVIADDPPDEEIPLNPYGVRSRNPYVVRRFWENGKEIDMVIVPGRPPEVYRASAATPPEPDIAGGTNTLSNVPAFDWCYGCSATSAAMMFGHYDNSGYPNMYAGPANGGVCPLTNATWGSGECPLSATHEGYDGLGVKGHVDDYWIASGSGAPDPWIGNWTEHTQGDCTGDYMGTNQSSFQNTDGSTRFYFYTDGSPLYDYTGAEPSYRDGCHGMKLFVESRGYTVYHDGSDYHNYSQYIKGQGSNPDLGFTFADFKTEIDAGRPVLIQVTGHTMLGYGYDDAGEKIWIHNTWDYSNYWMTWGGTYSTLQHLGVTVLHLATSTITFATSPATTGTITFDGTVYSDEGTVDKPAATYDIAAILPGGYTFNKWEVSGGLSVADSTSDTTTCTVTGSGTLKMVLDDSAGVTITFDTDPTPTGTISFDGVSWEDGDTLKRSTATYNVTGNPGSGYTFTKWEVTEDLVVGNSTSATTACEVNDAGTLTMVQSYVSSIAVGDSRGGSTGCFIATAAYSRCTDEHGFITDSHGLPITDYRSPITVLQRFRDEYLLTNTPGRAFISCYERISPPVARYIENKESLKAVVRFYLKPIVWGTRKILNLEE